MSRKGILLVLFIWVGLVTPLYAVQAPEGERNSELEDPPPAVVVDRFTSVSLPTIPQQDCSQLIPALKDYLAQNPDILRGLDPTLDLTGKGVYFVPGKAGLKDMCYVLFYQQMQYAKVEGSQVSFSVKIIQGVPKLVRVFARVYPEIPSFSAAIINLDPKTFSPLAASALGLSGAPTPALTKTMITYVQDKWRRVTLFKYAQEPGRRVLVDNETSETFTQSDRLYGDFQGAVKGRGVLFDPVATVYNFANLPLSHLKVTNPSNGAIAYTDSWGGFAIAVTTGAAPPFLTAALSGSWSEVSTKIGANLTAQIDASRSSTLQFNPLGYDEYDTAQVNAYYHTAFVHDWIVDRLPSLLGLDFLIPTYVNVNGSCNAYYTSGVITLNFNRSGYGCINAAYDTVIYHEYGHFVDDMAGGIEWTGPGLGLSEGWGDTLAAYITRQPLVGENIFYYPGTYIRTADNAYQFVSTDPAHIMGQAWSGFNWRLRENLKGSRGEAAGVALAEELVLPVFLANPLDIPSAVVEAVLRDDDDADLSNGTPHGSEILDAARRHGLDFVLSAHLENVQPLYGFVGSEIALQGSWFTPSQGRVTLNDLSLTPLYWSDALVRAKIPTGSRSGLIAVSQPSGFPLPSPPAYFTLISTMPTLVTLAGKGGFLGDGASSSMSQLSQPGQLAVEEGGNIYVADTLHHRIRKIDPSGIITTIAGNGKAGYRGDLGPAVNARLNHPLGVAVDAQGNVYIADTFNHRIRKVDRNGMISTIIGSNFQGYCGDSSPPEYACLDQPTSVAVDRMGSVYFADTQNHRVRKLDGVAGYVYTVAGTGEPGFGGDGGHGQRAMVNAPSGVAVDAQENIFIADTFNHRVRKVDSVSEVITTIAGNGEAVFGGDGGPAVSASLQYPGGVCVDAQGNIYIADTSNHRLRKIEASSRIIQTVAGGAQAGSGGDGGPLMYSALNAPGGVAIGGAGNIYISDTGNSLLRMRLEDTSPPSVSMTSPGEGELISEVVPLSATAWDDMGVVSVQFQVDGINLTPDIAQAPFGIFWQSASVSNGTHTLTAVARDWTGNRTVSPPRTITVWNALLPPTRKFGLVNLVRSDGSNRQEIKTSWDQGENQGLRAFLIHPSRGIDQSLVFGPQVVKASLTDLNGRVLVEVERSVEGQSLLIPLERAGGHLLCESGLHLIQMHVQGDGGDKVLAKPLLCVK